MALITCKECGTQISDQSEKCIKCGAPTAYSVEQNQEIQDNKNIEGEPAYSILQDKEKKEVKKEIVNEKPLNERKKNIKLIGTIISGILILSIIILVVFIFSGKGEKTDLSAEEVLAIGSVQELIAESNNPDAIELKKVEVGKCDDELRNEVGLGDYIVKITYGSENGNVGIQDDGTGEWYAYVLVILGDKVECVINPDNQAMLVMPFGFLDSVDIDINLIKKVLANPSKYDLDLKSSEKVLAEEKTADIINKDSTSESTESALVSKTNQSNVNEFKFDLLTGDEKVKIINELYLPLCKSMGVQTQEYTGADYGGDAGYHALNPPFGTDIDMGFYQGVQIMTAFNDQTDLNVALNEHICAVVSCIEANDDLPDNSETEKEIVSFYTTLLKDAMNHKPEEPFTIRDYGNLTFHIQADKLESPQNIIVCNISLREIN